MGAWKRIRDYSALKKSVPQAQALLTDVFAAANISDPQPAINALSEKLSFATAWDRANLDYLVGTHFALVVDNFKNEIALNRLSEIIKVAAKTGISAETMAVWGAAYTDFDALHETALMMGNTAKENTKTKTG